VKILIILDAKINSSHNFSTFEGMSSKNLLRQWNKQIYIYLKKMWGKIMINILHSLWLPMTIKGGKKFKSEITNY
jgi:hypothetical protein